MLLALYLHSDLKHVDNGVEFNKKNKNIKLLQFTSYLGNKSHPCPIIEPTVNQAQFNRVHVFSTSSGSLSHG